MAEYIKTIRTTSGDKQIDYEALANKPEVPFTVVIPMGWMRGDVNHDGVIDDTDRQEVARLNGTVLSNAFPDGNVPYEYLAADVNNDDYINGSDVQKELKLISGATKYGEYTELTGTWTSNPNYATEDAQFYIDIADARFSDTKDVTIVATDSLIRCSPSFQVTNGSMRVYVKAPPVETLTCVCMRSPGTGNAQLISSANYETLANKSEIPFTAVIPMGWMRGDTNHDGVINDDDQSIIQQYFGTNLSKKFPDGNIPYEYLAADMDNNGGINSEDLFEVMTISKYGAYTEITGNWISNPNYVTESAQFYTDILDARFSTSKNITIIANDSLRRCVPSFQVNNGFIRIYVEAPPIEDVACVFVLSSGTGEVQLISDTVNPSAIMEGGFVSADEFLVGIDMSFDVQTTDADQFHFDHFVYSAYTSTEQYGYGILGGDNEGLFAKVYRQNGTRYFNILGDTTIYEIESFSNPRLNKPMKNGKGDEIIAPLNGTVRAYGEKGHVLGFVDNCMLGDIDMKTSYADLSASDGSGGTLARRFLANATSQTDLAAPQIRNIHAGTTDLVAGTSELPTGTIYLVYE